MVSSPYHNMRWCRADGCLYLIAIAVAGERFRLYDDRVAEHGKDLRGRGKQGGME